MKINLELGDRRLIVNLEEACSIAIGLDFHGPQPDHYGVPAATSVPVRAAGFVGSTREGGSCNFEQVTLIPHCSGTHTETVGHIVNQQIDIADAVMQSWLMAILVSVNPVSAIGCGETYRPTFEETDRVITADAIDTALAAIDAANATAIVVRTGHESGPGNCPFFSLEATNRIVDLGFRHLVVDLPSIDRLRDEGLLTNHHLYWNVPEGSHDLTGESRRDCTITELVCIPDRLNDGHYLLNLQIAPFCSDAAPSRPILFPVHKA